MWLRSLRVQHFKSLANVVVEDFGRITVLVGPNGVGKSNTVDVLRFLRDVLVEGLEHAISKRGGIGLIRQYSRTKPFQVTFDLTFSENAPGELELESPNYTLSISSLPGGNYRVENESATWFESDRYFNHESEEWEGSDTVTPHTFERDVAGRVTVDGKGELTLPPDTIALGKPLFTTEFQGILGDDIAAFLGAFRFSAIYPNLLREPHRPDTDKALKETAENWASILRALRKTQKGKANLERVKQIMQVVTPDLQDVGVNTVGGFLVPHFKIGAPDAAASPSFDASQLSDGTLRVFAMLLALYQVPPPPFMAIEEPEQTIHPGILTTLSEVFAEVSHQTQLLLTSHSPHLIDALPPEAVRVVTIEKGLTKVSPIRPSQMEAIKERLMSPGEFMASEGLKGA